MRAAFAMATGLLLTICSCSASSSPNASQQPEGAMADARVEQGPDMGWCGPLAHWQGCDPKCPMWDPAYEYKGDPSCSNPNETCLYFEAFCTCAPIEQVWIFCLSGEPLSEQECPQGDYPIGQLCCSNDPGCISDCVGGHAQRCFCDSSLHSACSTIACGDGGLGNADGGP